MGFFSSTEDRYSEEKHELPVHDLRRIVSPLHIHSLKEQEAALVEEVVEAKRDGAGRISMRQTYHVLRDLRQDHHISEIDERALREQFQDYFSKRTQA